MKYLRRKCVYCFKNFDVRKGWHDETEGNMVMWRTDPFLEEIRDNHTHMWLCDDCAHDAAMDI